MPQNFSPDEMKIIGITGITGSGTSTVAKILGSYGGYVIQADKLAHEIMRKTEPAFDEILKIFGDDILDETTGEINRKALGAKVFGNPEAMAQLEKVIHPRVIKKTFEIISDVKANKTNAITKVGEGTCANCSFIVVDAPLLIESGLHMICTQVWLVFATNEIRLNRIITRDSIDIETATRRLKSRVGDDALRPYADVIIENNGDIASLRAQIAAALQQHRKEI